MTWVKRNLFFVIGGLVALGLLGAAGYYNYTSWARNSDEVDKLKEIYATLNSLNSPDANPGNDKINKIDQAKDQDAQLHAWLDQAVAWFQPIPPIPPSSPAKPVSNESYTEALRRTIDSLLHEADAANVVVPDLAPDKYAFSFKSERDLVKFSPGGLDALAAQLGEVKTIAEILYAAGVNELNSIQRVRVADEDANGPPADYISEQSITNNQVIITPYVITFQSFGPEIARVYAGFAASPHAFIIKSRNVLPAQPNANTPAPAPQFFPRGGDHMNPYGQTPGGPLPDKTGLVTVFKEQLLRVSMEIEIIKLPPKK